MSNCDKHFQPTQDKIFILRMISSIKALALISPSFLVLELTFSEGYP